MNEINQAEFLRSDSKSLLYSLRKHQDVVKESLYRLKSEDKDVEKSNEEFKDEVDYKVSNFEKNLYKNEFNFDVDKTRFNDVTDEVNEILLTRNLGFKKVGSIKTVSFSDYPRTLGSRKASPRRRSRSVSPFLGLTNKTPKKSILKKQLVQDELSDSNETEPSNLNSDSSFSSNASTNSLLCSDIYGGFKSEQNEEFDDNLRAIMHMGESNIDSTIKTNKSKFIDLITQKRQVYLNHNYTESLSSENSSKLNESQKKEDTRSSKSVDPSKYTRAYSADSERISSINSNSSVVHDKKVKPSVNMISRRIGLNKFKELKKASLTKQSIHKSPLKDEQELDVSLTTTPSLIASTKNENYKKDKSRNYKKLANQIRKQKPLLGFDWAIGKY